MIDDIFKKCDEQELANMALYSNIIELLNEIKLTYGAEVLNATLRRHKKIMLFLKKYQKTTIIDLESKITDNLNCRLGE